MDIVANLKHCRNDLLVWRKSAKNTCEPVFGPESVDSSVFDKSSGKSGVPISIVVELGSFQFTTDSPHDPPFPGPLRGTPIPGKGRKRENLYVFFSTRRSFSWWMVLLQLPARTAA